MDKLIESVYWYYTNFCVNAVKLLGISYVEWNIWLFLVLLPGLVLLLLVLNVWRYLVGPLLREKG